MSGGGYHAPMAEAEENRKKPAGYTPSTPRDAPPRPAKRAPEPAPEKPRPAEAPAAQPAEAPAPRAPEKAAEPKAAEKAAPEEPLIDRGAPLEERLSLASVAQLRTRRERIDRRLLELAEPVGVAALALGAPVHGTKVVDIDRIVKKIDRTDNDIADAEKLTEPRAEGFFKALGQDLARLSERFASRELHQKRARLVAELGLALLACELRVVRDRQPEVGALLEKHKDDARTVDELFRQARLVDEELDRRAKDGRLHKEPKAIEKLLSRTGEVVGDASDAAKDKIVDLSKTAAKTAVKQSGKAVWSLAKGAFKLGQKKLTGDEDSDEDAADEGSEDEPPRAKKKSRSRRSPDDESDEGPSKKEVPELIRQLGKLHKDGVLTDEEFAKKKAELLKRL